MSPTTTFRADQVERIIRSVVRSLRGWKIVPCTMTCHNDQASLTLRSRSKKCSQGVTIDLGTRTVVWQTA
jgi:hypothetical protein